MRTGQVWRNCASITVAAAILWTAGCGSGALTAPETAPVSGTVTRQGKPVAGVRVTLHPTFDLGEIKYLPSGETDREGKFAVSTAAPGDGAPPGDYIVTLEKPRVVSDRNQSGIEVEIDDLKGKYSDPGTSAWKAIVIEGANQLNPFDIE